MPAGDRVHFEWKVTRMKAGRLTTGQIRKLAGRVGNILHRRSMAWAAQRNPVGTAGHTACC